jgi:hypothetical protein
MKKTIALAVIIATPCRWLFYFVKYQRETKEKQ